MILPDVNILVYAHRGDAVDHLLYKQWLEGVIRSGQPAGNLIPDLWFAALAIESGCEWIACDGDYEKIPGLPWRHPIIGKASKQDRGACS